MTVALSCARACTLREEVCAPFEETAEDWCREGSAAYPRRHDAEVTMDVGEDFPDEVGFVGAEVNALPRGAEPLVVRLLGGRVAERLGAASPGSDAA